MSLFNIQYFLNLINVSVNTKWNLSNNINHLRAINKTTDQLIVNIFQKNTDAIRDEQINIAEELLKISSDILTLNKSEEYKWGMVITKKKFIINLMLKTVSQNTIRKFLYDAPSQPMVTNRREHDYAELNFDNVNNKCFLKNNNKVNAITSDDPEYMDMNCKETPEVQYANIVNNSKKNKKLVENYMRFQELLNKPSTSSSAAIVTGGSTTLNDDETPLYQRNRSSLSFIAADTMSIN
ncbi:uncharacterized protein LOC141528831 [Cotesia typhae]|uniref:uncharacterized protein LOC141528831 n=1 Tax=Cotesia typhae TaxID=2053667 RepID=UPI003D690E14